MLYFITLLGFLLRMTFLNKPEGLWNDEYVSWYIANTPLGNSFLQEVLKQCHMPLYYLYLKPFAGCSDLILRLTSVVAGVVAIPVMYLVGKEFSKKTANIAAVITSILPFLIYYSQEVRFYSLLFTFSALSLLFTIKFIKSEKYKLAWLLSLLLIVFTHVLGGIYVLFNLTYVIYKKKKISLKILGAIFIGTIFILFFGFNIIKMLPTSQWWGHFSYTNVLFLFTDFFSPILTNNVNAPPVFFYNKSYALWMILPCLIILYPLYLGVKRARGLFTVAVLTLLAMFTLAILEKIVFITKYSIEVLPIFILLISIGFAELKRNILFIVFVSIQLLSFFTPNYVTKIPRSEGHRIPCEILKARNPQTILFTYYDSSRFVRYIDLKDKRVLSINKSNRFAYKDAPQKILNDVKLGEVVSVVFLDSVSFFDENFLKVNADNSKIPEMFITFSQIKNRLVRSLDGNYNDFRVDKMGSWTVVTAKRYK